MTDIFIYECDRIRAYNSGEKENMASLEWIISLASAVIGLIAAIAAVALKCAKNAKVKRAAEKALEICGVLIPFVEEAETFTHYSGAEKKAYVMTKVGQLNLRQKVVMDDEFVSKMIEEYIRLSKRVNTKPSSGRLIIPSHTECGQNE